MTSTVESSALTRSTGRASRLIFVCGKWIESTSHESFQATNPATSECIDADFPISGSTDIDAALKAADDAYRAGRALGDLNVRVAAFLTHFADEIEARAPHLAGIAEAETGLSAQARFAAIEIPRTVRQLRLAATAASDRSWCSPTIDTQNDIRSCLAPIGPVFVIGPNNFPFAFNAISGGDFAAALAAGNPVIAKGHPLHPNTTHELAQIASDCAESTGLPPGMIQLLYHMHPEDGLRLIRDRRCKAIAFTGSRKAGMSLKAAADGAGKLFFGEMSSLNPVVVLPGALAESGDSIAEQFASSVLAGTGQFCTKPGLLLLIESAAAESFLRGIVDRLDRAPAGVLLSASGAEALRTSIATITNGGAARLTATTVQTDVGARVPNTLLRIDASAFLQNPETFQTEAFGNASLVVTASDSNQLCDVLEQLEGNLTGSIYSSNGAEDDALYARAAMLLRPRVGRLMNDKMPTGVVVSPAMNHGGPFPASSHPHLTAVGLPQSIKRFTQLECYDKVRQDRLPSWLRDGVGEGDKTWRLIDGAWTKS